MKKGYTLIELLTVIGIISVMAIVVVFIVNPAELLRQGRDATRVSDMNTLNKAISLYYQDALSSPSTLFMGTSSVVYVSIPDPSATSTAGDQCQGLNLPALPTSTYSYHCAASSTFLRVDGTGWVPINFNSYSAGSVISKLPVDPVNATSTDLYYTYETDGVGGFKVAAFFESQKYASQMANDGGNDTELYEKGSNLALASGRGLLGYWPMNEGTGSSTIDYSGGNVTGTWNGNVSGTNGYYSTGKVGPWAGTFDGSTDYITTSSSLPSITQFTFTAWVKLGSLSGREFVVWLSPGDLEIDSGELALGETGCGSVATSLSAMATSTWYLVAETWNGTTPTLYVNGSAVSASRGSCSYTSIGNAIVKIGVYTTVDYFNGLIDDVRIYNRVLSAAEIQEMYNAEK